MDRANLTLYLRPEEREDLKRLASFSERSESGVIRLLIRSAARKLIDPNSPTPQPIRQELQNEHAPVG